MIIVRNHRSTLSFNQLRLVFERHIDQGSIRESLPILGAIVNQSIKMSLITRRALSTLIPPKVCIPSYAWLLSSRLMHLRLVDSLADGGFCPTYPGAHSLCLAT